MSTGGQPDAGGPPEGQAADQTCGTCGYWVSDVVNVDTAKSPSQKTRAEGACRRYLPDGAHTWRLTYTDEWCGEWAPARPRLDTVAEDRTPELPQPGDLGPMLSGASYARLRKLYTKDQLQALVLSGREEEPTSKAALRALAHLEETFLRRRAPK